MITYIDVPYAARHRAKALGARFDMAKRQWYVPDGLDLAAFKEWTPAGLRGWLGNLPTRAKNARVRSGQKSLPSAGSRPGRYPSGLEATSRKPVNHVSARKTS